MIATVAIVADYAGTLDLSDRTEVRARTTEQASAPVNQPVTAQTQILGIDVLTRPEARLRLNDRVWEASLSYAPSLILPDLELGVTPQLFNVGNAAVSWHDRLVRVAIAEDASYGLESSAYLLPAQTVPGQPPVVQPSAEPTTILFGSSHTYGSLAVRVGRRALITVGADYLLSGGVDAASRAVIPEQYGPRASASFAYDLARNDRITTLASVQDTNFAEFICTALTVPGQTVAAGTPCAPQAVIGLGEETLTHKLSRTTSLTLGLGGAVSGSRLETNVPYGEVFFPVADASLLVRFGREGKSQFQILGRLAPYVSWITGTVANNLIGEASLRDELTGRLTLRFTVGAAQTLPTDEPAAATILRGDVEVDYRPSKFIELAIGERGLWQDESGYGVFVSTFGFAAVTVRAPTLHF